MIGIGAEYEPLLETTVKTTSLSKDQIKVNDDYKISVAYWL